jgi:hypothetical protein
MVAVSCISHNTVLKRFCDPRSHRGLCKVLSEQGKCRVLSLRLNLLGVTNKDTVWYLRQDGQKV